MMIWRAVLKVLVPLGFVWAIVWCQAPAAALNGGIDGYKTIVDRVLIGQRIIRTTNAVAGLPGDAITSAAPLVKVDEARLAQTDLDGVRGAVRIFLKRSAILGEIARNDPARWKIDNSLIELNNPTGKFLSPFAYTEWTGQLLFAGARPAGRWAVRVGTGDWQPIEALQDEALAGWQASRCNSGCQFELSRHTALKPAGELRLTLNDASWSGGSPSAGS